MAATTCPVNMIRGGTLSDVERVSSNSSTIELRDKHLHVVPKFHIVEHCQALCQGDVRVRLMRIGKMQRAWSG